MSFGYVPHQNSWKNLILKVLGHPNLIRRIQVPLLMRMLEPNEEDVILDVGCGGGFFSYEIAKKCKTAVGIDWNLNKSLSFAMKKQPNVIYLKGDVQKLPFASEKFDRILLSSVLQMVEGEVSLVKECRRVLKRQGIIVLSMPLRYIWFNALNTYKSQIRKKFGGSGVWHYSSEKVINLLESKGFELLEVEYSPKLLGSLIYEAGLFLWYRFNFPFFSPFLFPLLYPIAYFDRFADKRQKGNELIIKAKKAG